VARHVDGQLSADANKLTSAKELMKKRSDRNPFCPNAAPG